MPERSWKRPDAKAARAATLNARRAQLAVQRETCASVLRAAAKEPGGALWLALCAIARAEGATDPLRALRSLPAGE